MRMTAHFALLALALAAAGCRSGFDASEESGGESDTGTPCPEGSPGCPCYGNSSCDGELVCTGGYCLDPDCTEGTENCPCYPNSTCNGDLVCEPSGICKPPAGTDGGTTTDDPDTAETSTSSEGTTTGDPTGDPTTDPSTSGPTTGPSGSETSTTDDSTTKATLTMAETLDDSETTMGMSTSSSSSTSTSSSSSGSDDTMGMFMPPDDLGGGMVN
jgi:hypothetical protein